MFPSHTYFSQHIHSYLTPHLISDLASIVIAYEFDQDAALFLHWFTAQNCDSMAYFHTYDSLCTAKPRRLSTQWRCHLTQTDTSARIVLCCDTLRSKYPVCGCEVIVSFDELYDIVYNDHPSPRMTFTDIISPHFRRYNIRDTEIPFGGLIRHQMELSLDQWRLIAPHYHPLMTDPPRETSSSIHNIAMTTLTIFGIFGVVFLLAIWAYVFSKASPAIKFHIFFQGF